MKKLILRNFLISVVMLLSFIQFMYGQDTLPIIHTQKGILWVVPKRADAFPVNGNRTGNPGLNLAFEDYHVVEYVFVDSLYFYGQFDLNGNQLKIAVYQIRLQEEYAHWEISMLYLLHDCYFGFFDDFASPYNIEYNNGQTLNFDNGRVILEFEDYYFDPTLFPRSNTRSYNKPMNLILKKYDIKSYKYIPIMHQGDTAARWIEIICHYQDALPLYKDLLNIHYLYEFISMTGSYIFLEQSGPCGPYSGFSSEVEKSIQVFPNPAQDEITISGIEPEYATLYDIMGKIVVSKFDTETNKIDISQLPSGFYVIKITSTDGKFYTSKIVKQ